ncbi:MAG: hypothetical protein JW936_10480 [Sedimentisphaerales bacterium]|nr:hypothetical protein [Sedimentisphaerales bacterium]
MDDGKKKVLPGVVLEYIELLVKKVRYRRKVREDVREELIGHFVDALKDCADEGEREKVGKELVEAFGDVKALGKLIRRGKKRCRVWWKKAIIRSLQGLGILILAFIVYVGLFVNDRPVVRVDYLARLNAISRPDLPEELNAWPLLDRAAGEYISLPSEYEDLNRGRFGESWEELSDEERGVLNEWMAENEQAWRDFGTASARLYYWREYDFSEGSKRAATEEDPKYALWNESLFSVALPNLGAFRDVAKQGIWRSRRARVAGDWETALADCAAVARVGALQQGKGMLIEQLVGMAIGSLASGEMIRLAMEPGVPLELLTEAQERWGEIYADGYPMVNLDFEVMTQYDTVQRAFTDGGIGGGHVTVQALLNLEDDSIHNEDRIWVNDLETISWALVHARRDEVMAICDKWGALIKRQEDMTPYELRASGEETAVDDMIIGLSEVRYFIPRSLLPALGRASAVAFRAKAEYEAALTILALRVWEMERGDWPGSLEELVAAGYLAELPRDPYSAGSLVYRREGDSFVLYSLGEDFDDDGGWQNPDSPWGHGDEGGDRVFWPR